MSGHSQRELGRGDWILGAIKRNPEGLLLLAAGCALLMRRAGFRPLHGNGSGPDADRNDYTGRNGPHQSLGDTVAQAARNAGEYASDVTHRVTETASSYASSVSDFADEASEQSGRFARQAQSTLQSTAQHVLQEQPLAVALVGLATGAAVAAALPATDVERRALGPTGERLRDAAGRAGDQLKEAGAQAGERLMSAAEERGLTGEGLKEVAREVGDAFSDALSGEETSRNDQAQSTRSKQEGGGSRSDEGIRQRSQGLQAGGSSQGPTKREGAPSNPGGKRGPR